MPTYNFRHKETGEVVQKIIKMSEHSAWVETNPQYEQVHLDTPNLGDGVRLGITKPPSDFQKYIIGKVAQMPGADIHSKFGIPKEY